MTVLGCLSLHPEIPFPVAVLGREFRRGWLETRLRMVRVAWMEKIMGRRIALITPAVRLFACPQSTWRNLPVAEAGATP